MTRSRSFLLSSSVLWLLSLLTSWSGDSVERNLEWLKVPGLWKIWNGITGPVGRLTKIAVSGFWDISKITRFHSGTQSLAIKRLTFAGISVFGWTNFKYFCSLYTYISKIMRHTYESFHFIYRKSIKCDLYWFFLIRRFHYKFSWTLMFLTEVEKLRMFRHMISQLRSNFGCTGSHPFWIMTPRSVPLFPDRLSLIAPREFLVLIMDSATSLSLLQSSSSGTRGPVGPPTFLRQPPKILRQVLMLLLLLFRLTSNFCGGSAENMGALDSNGAL